uniref:hypothetical protein n=1 Tax=Escherichia coli TaxID=562 RepID=UPI001CDA76BA
MTTNKRHILLNGYVSPENYRSRSNGRSPQVPARDRAVHGISLLNQYSRILNHYDERPRLPPVTDEKGIYVREGANKQVISSQADSLIKI